MSDLRLRIGFGSGFFDYAQDWIVVCDINFNYSWVQIPLQLLVIMWSIIVEDVSVTLMGLVIRGTAPLMIIVLIYSVALCDGFA